MERLFLSRRNLETLLAKLDRTANGDHSMCTIIKSDARHTKYPQTMSSCMVTAVEDTEYYNDREPGQVHPNDEPVRGYN